MALRLAVDCAERVVERGIDPEDLIQARQFDDAKDVVVGYQRDDDPLVRACIVALQRFRDGATAEESSS